MREKEERERKREKLEEKRSREQPAEKLPAKCASGYCVTSQISQVINGAFKEQLWVAWWPCHAKKVLSPAGRGKMDNGLRTSFRILAAKREPFWLCLSLSLSLFHMFC